MIAIDRKLILFCVGVGLVIGLVGAWAVPEESPSRPDSRPVAEVEVDPPCCSSGGNNGVPRANLPVTGERTIDEPHVGDL